jgi:hypothetical protein
VTAGDLRRHRRLFLTYSALYPIVFAVCQLDRLLPSGSGHMLIASATRLD